MSSRRSPRQLLVTLLLGILIGGGLMAVTPAGAEISQAASTSWKKIWKQNLKPLADKRYYTKKQSGATFSTKTEAAAAATAANTTTDAKLGGYYTKAQADAKYAPIQPLYRGTYLMSSEPLSAATLDTASISFGATFPAAPIPHYIKVGDPVPAGCSGNAAAPNAAPGHFCVFESAADNTAFSGRGICRGERPRHAQPRLIHSARRSMPRPAERTGAPFRSSAPGQPGRAGR